MNAYLHRNHHELIIKNNQTTVNITYAVWRTKCKPQPT